MTDTPQLIMIEGRDAVALLIVRPGPTGYVELEVHCAGLPKLEFAALLRRLAGDMEARHGTKEATP